MLIQNAGKSHRREWCSSGGGGGDACLNSWMVGHAKRCHFH